MSHFQFGDKRLERRCRQCIKRIDEAGAHKSFPCIFKDRHELKAFYRLMNHQYIGHEDFFASYQRGLEEQIQKQATLPRYKRLYLFADSTFGKYNDREKLQLGYLETLRGNGLVLHTGLLTDSQWVPLGAAVQQIILRDPADFGKRHERHERAFEEKESYKWTQSIDWAKQFSEQTGIEIIQVMDREADIADLFNYAHAQGQSFIVRARHDRKVQGSSVKLWDYLRQQSPAKHLERQLLDKKGKPHMVPCQIRYAPVRLPDIEAPMWAIHLLALDSSIDLEQTEWLLLTNVAVQEPPQAELCLNAYTHRWRTCEDFHKCLKTGCKIEKRQFDSLKALANAIALLSLVAIRLLRMRHLAQTEGQSAVEQVLDSQEIQLAQLLAQQYLKPSDQKHCQPNTVLWWVLLLGRMGGHQGYSQKGLPGWQTLFHGWNYFQTLLKGINLSKNFFSNSDP